jgi:hypothetical protein
MFASSSTYIHLLPTFPRSKYPDIFSPWLPIEHFTHAVLTISMEGTVIPLQLPI